LRLGVRFADTWKPQLEAIRIFLGKQGIALGPVGTEKRKDGRLMYRLDVGQVRSVIKVMRSLLPLCVKKHEDLRISLDYFENKTTGDEAVERYNFQISIGRRRGIRKTAHLPYTREEGLGLYQKAKCEKGASGTSSPGTNLHQADDKKGQEAWDGCSFIGENTDILIGLARE